MLFYFYFMLLLFYVALIYCIIKVDSMKGNFDVHKGVLSDPL